MITDIKEFVEVPDKFVAVPIRISDDEQLKDKKLAIQDQKIRLTSALQELNIKNYKFYIYFISGFKLKKCKEFQEMIQDCRDAKVSLIFCLNHTRFMRNASQYSDYLSLLINKLQIPIYYLESNALVKNTLSSDILVNQILGASAEHYRNSAKENSLRDMETKARDFGEFLYRAPFGYYDVNKGKFDSKGKKIPLELKIDPAKAEIVKQIYSDIKKGITLTQLSKKYSISLSSTICIIENIKKKVYRGFIPFKDLEGTMHFYKGKHEAILETQQ